MKGMTIEIELEHARMCLCKPDNEDIKCKNAIVCEVHSFVSTSC